MKTKKDKAYSYGHTKQRAFERYNIELTPAIYEEWFKLCNLGNRIQTDPTNKQEVHVIEWSNRKLTVVVKHKKTNSQTYEMYISTVLPEGTKLMFGSNTPNYRKVADWYKNGSTTQQK